MAALLPGLAGCATTPARELGQAELAVRDAEHSGAGERAVSELSLAREKLDRARAAEERGDELAARRLAAEATVDARLAEVRAEAAAADPQVVEHAPRPLQEARASLDRARLAHRSGESKEEVDHLAYLASRHAEIARAAAARETDVERAEELSRQEPLPAPLRAPLVARPARAEPLHFEPERETLQPGEWTELERLAAWLRLYPDQTVRVEGHADETERDPLAISEERASEVARQLALRGVESERLYVRGLGDSAPAASSATAAGRQLNRRVEIVVGPTLGAR